MPLLPPVTMATLPYRLMDTLLFWVLARWGAPRQRLTVAGGVVMIRWATRAVQPVWCSAPRPMPVSPWKYSWNGMLSLHRGSVASRSYQPCTGRRPVHGTYDLLATDPRWKDNLPFHEYFHGDTGMGLGAAHQTGWTALVAHLILTTPPD